MHPWRCLTFARDASAATGAEVGIDTEVDLGALVLEPAAPSLLQMGRLRHPLQAEQALVEVLCRRFAALGHGELYMVDRHHGLVPSARSPPRGCRKQTTTV